MEDSVNANSFTGTNGVNVYRATVFASALRLYAKTGIKVNRAYTPTAMMKVATEITGVKFKARDYEGAAEVLTTWARDMAAKINGN